MKILNLFSKDDKKTEEQVIALIPSVKPQIIPEAKQPEARKKPILPVVEDDASLDDAILLNEQLKRNAEMDRKNEEKRLALKKLEAEVKSAKLAALAAKEETELVEVQKLEMDAQNSEIEARQAEFEKRIKEAKVLKLRMVSKKHKIDQELDHLSNPVIDQITDSEVFCGVDFHVGGRANVWVFKRIGTDIVLVGKESFS